MALDANDKELTVWGFAKGMRTGLMTFFLAAQMMAIIYLYVDRARADKEKAMSEAEKLIIQGKLYEQMIEYIKPTRDKMDGAAEKVDKAATVAIAASAKMDSLSTPLLIQQQRKR